MFMVHGKVFSSGGVSVSGALLQMARKDGVDDILISIVMFRTSFFRLTCSFFLGRQWAIQQESEGTGWQGERIWGGGVADSREEKERRW